MKKRLKITRLEEAVDLIHMGAADTVQATAEYRGQDYLIEVKLKGSAEEAAISAPAVSPTFDAMMLSARLEETLLGPEGKRHIDNFPWLTLPQGYSFKVIFPFCGAAARFRVCKTDHPERDVSVYLDTKDVLGCVGQPYWEAYPIGEDTGRWLLGETEEMIAAIVAELDSDQPSRDSVGNKNNA